MDGKDENCDQQVARTTFLGLYWKGCVIFCRSKLPNLAGIIHLLPDNIANQIAAGKVIQINNLPAL